MRYKRGLIASISSSEFQFIVPFLGQGNACRDQVAFEFWFL